MLADPADLADRLRELRAWADGYQETNEQRARSVRSLINDLEELLVAYADEKRGRIAMQANYERALHVMSTRLYQRSAYGPRPEPVENPFL